MGLADVVSQGKSCSAERQTSAAGEREDISVQTTKKPGTRHEASQFADRGSGTSAWWTYVHTKGRERVGKG
jgi:hypothetical protein